MSVDRYLRDAGTLQYDAEKCNGCRMCIYVCPHEVFKMNSKRVKVVDRDACMECGACSRNCETGALTVEAGVGCAYAIIIGKLRHTEPTCGCSDDVSCC